MIGAALIGAVILLLQIIFPLFLLSAKICPEPVVTANKFSFTANPPLIIPVVSSIFFFNFFFHFFLPLFLFIAVTVSAVSSVYIFS